MGEQSNNLGLINNDFLKYIAHVASNGGINYRER
jgi:hypothetical protein